MDDGCYVGMSCQLSNSGERERGGRGDLARRQKYTWDFLGM